MSLISWSPELSVNIDFCDKQHKDLIRMINRLYEAVNEGQYCAGEIFTDLAGRIIAHLEDEVLLLQQNGFPSVAEANERNEKFFKQVLCDLQLYFQLKNELSPLVLILLCDWIVNHVEEDIHVLFSTIEGMNKGETAMSVCVKPQQCQDRDLPVMVA